jgi:hypothetical protein
MTRDPKKNPPKIVSATVVPWEQNSWGVALVFADGHHTVYPTESFEQARRHVDNVRPGLNSAKDARSAFGGRKP